MMCALVVIGVNERGEKRFLPIEDGVRESTQSWREVLLKLKSRGMRQRRHSDLVPAHCPNTRRRTTRPG